MSSRLGRPLFAGSGISHVMLPGVLALRAALLTRQPWGHHPLAMCPRSMGPKSVADIQLLVRRTDSTKN